VNEMSRLFTADQHFGHQNILKYEAENRVNEFGRTFKTVEQMDEYLVDQWNSVVGIDDEVYCLGDVCMKMTLLREILPFLNGRKILIVGNHDPFFKRVVNNQVAEARAIALEVGFNEMHVDLELTVPGVGPVRLNHFPYLPPSPEVLPDYELKYQHLYPQPRGEALLLHGHRHSEWRELVYPGMPPMLNVGIDLWGLKPISEAEIVAKYEKMKGLGRG
jgi:calcineurin-like phosphoesterase family protein